MTFQRSMPFVSRPRVKFKGGRCHSSGRVTFVSHPMSHLEEEGAFQRRIPFVNHPKIKFRRSNGAYLL